jgi:hypothetical protein
VVSAQIEQYMLKDSDEIGFISVFLIGELGDHLRHNMNPALNGNFLELCNEIVINGLSIAVAINQRYKFEKSLQDVSAGGIRMNQALHLGLERLKDVNLAKVLVGVVFLYFLSRF